MAINQANQILSQKCEMSLEEGVISLQREADTWVEKEGVREVPLPGLL